MGWQSRPPGSGSQAFARSGKYTAPTFGRTIPCCHAVVRRSRHDFLIRCFCHLFDRPSNRRPRRTLGSWLSWKLQVDHRQRCRQKPSSRRMIPPLHAVQSRRLAMRAVYRVTNPLGLDDGAMTSPASACLAVTAETMPTSSGIQGTGDEIPPEEASTGKPQLAAATLPACPTSRSTNGNASLLGVSSWLASCRWRTAFLP